MRKKIAASVREATIAVVMWTDLHGIFYTS